METPPSIVSIPVPLVAAFVFVVLASYFRYVSLRGKTNWNKAWDQVDPSLKSSPPAATTMSRGCTGLLTWLFGWVLVIAFLLLAADYAFTYGRFTQSAVDRVVAYFE